jgi:hypothetical protein
MGQRIQLQDKDGNLQYPVTSTTLVVDPNGKTVEERLQEIGQGGGSNAGASSLSELADVNVSEAQDGEFLMFDDGTWVPQRISTSSGSTIITVDSEMSSVSANPVQNKVIKKYVDDAEAEAKKYTDEKISQIEVGGGSIIVDTEMSDTSENAVQNKVIKKYIDDYDVYLEGYAEQQAIDAEKAAKQYTDEKIAQIEIGGGDIDTSDFATKDDLNTKQDIINDLDTIRSGAAKGETAIQQVKTINGEEIVGEGNIEINVDTSTLATKEELTNLINEVIDDEEVLAHAINDLNERVNELEESGGGDPIIVDSELSDTSENPVQNKVIYETFAATFEEMYSLHENQDNLISGLTQAYTDLVMSKTDKTYVDEKVDNITNEMIDDEEVLAHAINDLNERLEALTARIATLESNNA